MPIPFPLSRLVLGLLCCLSSLVAAAQAPAPLELAWFESVKCPKDHRTLALLNADEKGSLLLRLQAPRSTDDGKRLPAQPFLTGLHPSGELSFNIPIPDFTAESGHAFRFALANDSVVLVAYETKLPAGGYVFSVRRFNIALRAWSAAPLTLFSAPDAKASPFGGVQYRFSPSGKYLCIYNLYQAEKPGVVSFLIFDRNFQRRWHRSASVPEQSGPIQFRQVFCSDSGQVAAHARVFNNKGVSAAWAAKSFASRADGRPFLQAQPDDPDNLPPYADVLFLIAEKDKNIPVFFPNIGKKYAGSAEICEDAQGRILLSGFGASAPGMAESFFVYALDVHRGKGEMLQNAPLTGPLRKIFLSEKEAAQKQPIPGLRLRWLDWTDDGRAWVLAEEERYDGQKLQVGKAALIRLDSAYRIANVKAVDKTQTAQFDDRQCFASLSAWQGPKSGWFFLWNKGAWPDTRAILTECRSGGAPDDYELAASNKTGISLLPHTVLRKGDKIYFAGESEYHERFAVGVLTKQKKH